MPLHHAPGVRLPLVVLLGLKSLVAHRVKGSFVVGILGFGTFLLITGSALLASVEAATSESVRSSLAGDLQVYSADAEDGLTLFGGVGIGSSDIGEMPDFAPIEATIGAMPEVAAVVPMAIMPVTVFAENGIDRVLEELAAAVATPNDGDPARSSEAKEHVRTMLDALAPDVAARAAIEANPDHSAAGQAALSRAQSPAFWAGFDEDPASALEFLSVNVAPLAADGRVLSLRLLGTDPPQFAERFDRFQLVEGRQIPSGQRGFLFSQRTYERVVKSKIARDLDALHDAVAAGGRIAQDPLLREDVSRLSREYASILYDLDPGERALLLPKLQQLLGTGVAAGVPRDLPALLEAFFTLDDTTLEPRFQFFYAAIAPLVRLYELPVGGTITLRATTRTGYVKAVSVPVFGTYAFKGLESSELAGTANLVDLVTWRELYGKMSTGEQAELSSMKAELHGGNDGFGAIDVRAMDAAALDAAFFDAPQAPTPDAEEIVSGGAFDEFAGVDLKARRARATRSVGQAGQTGDSPGFDPAELHRGLVLNAAILLHDPAQAAPVAHRIQALSDHLGLGIQVVDWKGATGMLGQLILVMRGVLYSAILMIFLVALIIINNSMVSATLERASEIGTMRAIGATRSFVVGMFLVEALGLGGIASAIGAGLSALLVGWLGWVGVPAPADVFVLLFAGPRLYPTTTLTNHAFGASTILAVSLVSTLYPAWLAAGVRPALAMQGKE